MSSNKPQPSVYGHWKFKAATYASEVITRILGTSGHFNGSLDACGTARSTPSCFIKIMEVLPCTECHEDAIDDTKNKNSSKNGPKMHAMRCAAALVSLLLITTLSVAAIWSLPYQQAPTEAATPSPRLMEKTLPRKHCQQIGTKEACGQNEDCRWLTRKHCCVEGHTPTFQFKETVRDEPRWNLSKIDSGELIGQQDENGLRTLYLEYLVKYSKPESRLDDPVCRETFRLNFNRVLEHNKEFKLGQRTWSKAVNFFSDMTDEETKIYTERIVETPPGDLGSSTTIRRRRLAWNTAKSLDYRDKGVVTPVKDQGNCASSLAFAAISCMESKHAMLTNETIDLSEQHVLDCSKSYGNRGCAGGSFRATFEFMKNVGVDTEAENEYKALGNERCRADKKKYDNQIVEWRPIDQGEDVMKEAIVKHGPIVASIAVDKEFFSYGDGVFTVRSNAMPNHAVLIVGYGEIKGYDVWFIKNSWGKGWGQAGFMSIQRNQNLCQIADGAYAIVSIKTAS